MWGVLDFCVCLHRIRPGGAALKGCISFWKGFGLSHGLSFKRPSCFEARGG
jgi:hypothetical protein